MKPDKFKDECGVMAVHNHREASTMAYLGLHQLQHRGQESAGVVSSNGERLFVHKAMGEVAEIFTEEVLSKLPGNLAIADGSFVVARGAVRPDGTLAATQVRIRRKGITPGFESEVTLAGPISDFVSLADFRVRGVRVDASRATQRACSGNGTTIGNGRDVEVGGAIDGDKVVAELLVCR